MYDILSLNEKLLTELKEIAKQLKIEGFDHLRKQDLIYKILDHQALSPEITQDKKADFVIPKTPEIKTEPMSAKKEDDSDKPKRRRISPLNLRATITSEQ